MLKTIELYSPSFSDIINAIKSKNVKQFNEWKAAGLSLNLKGPDALTPLLYLVSKNLNDDIQFFAQHCPEAIISQFQSGLAVAASLHQFDLFRKLLDHYETIKPHVSVVFSENDLLRCYQTGLQIVVKSLDYLKYSEDDIEYIAIDSPPIKALEDSDELLDAFDVDDSVEIPSIEELEEFRVLIGKIDTILQWGFTRQQQDLFDEYSNVFKSALNVNNFEIMKMIFVHLLSHYFNRNTDLMLQHFERMFISAASQGRHDIIDWLDEIQEAIQFNNVERYQDILNRALIKAVSINFWDVRISIPSQYNTIHKLIRRINNLTPSVLSHCLRLTIDNLSDIGNIHADYLQLTDCIEYMISVARSNKIFNTLLINHLKYLNDHDFMQEIKLKLFLFAIEQSFFRDSFPEENKAIDLSHHRLGDPSVSFLIKSLGEVEKRIRKNMNFSGFYFLSLNLSYNADLSHETAYALSQWLCGDCRVTRLDLSNNPLLGGGSWSTKSGLQMICLALVKNTSLRILNLANTGLNDDDFATLVMLLENNTVLDAIDLSANKALTEKSESLLMSLLLTRNKKKMPLLKFTFFATVLEKSPALKFTKDSEQVLSKEVLDRPLIDYLKGHLKEAQSTPVRRDILLRGVVLDSDKRKTDEIEMSNNQISDAEGSRFVEVLRESSILEPSELVAEVTSLDPVNSLLSDWIILSSEKAGSSSSQAKSKYSLALFLSYNCLSYNAMSTLSRWFYDGLCTLQILDLSYNPQLGGGTWLSYSGLQKLALALHKNNSLRQLKVPGCGVNDRDLKTLVKWLVVDKTLVELDLSSNDALTLASVAPINTALKTRFLENMPAVRPCFTGTCIEETVYSNDEDHLIAFQNQFRLELKGFKLESLGLQKVQESDHSVKTPYLSYLKDLATCILSLIAITGGVAVFAAAGAYLPFLIIAGASSNLAKILLGFLHTVESGVALAEMVEGGLHCHHLYVEYMHKHYQKIENIKNIRLVAERLRRLSYEVINYDLPEKIVQRFSHEYAEPVTKLHDFQEARLLAKALVTRLRIFVNDKSPQLNGITFFEDFAQWLLSAPLVCFDILRLEDKKSPSDSLNNQQSFNEINATSSTIKCGDKIYARHPVNPNGDCGYTAFHIERDEAYRCLMANIEEVRDILKPIIVQELTTTDKFVNALPERYEPLKQLSREYFAAIRRRESDLERYEILLKKYAEDLNLISAYLELDVREGKIDNGWCHPLILFALGQSRGVSVYLFQDEENGQMIPHRQYPEYRTEGNDSVELLFTHFNHFDQVELCPQPTSSLDSSPNSSKTASQNLLFVKKALSQQANAEPIWMWTAHFLTGTGLQCLNARGDVVKFDIMIKDLSNKESEVSWISTRGECCGYRRASPALLKRIQSMIYTHRHSKEHCRIIDNEMGLSLAMLKFLVIQGELVAIPSTYISKGEWRFNVDKSLIFHDQKLVTANLELKNLTKKLEGANKAAKNAEIVASAANAKAQEALENAEILMTYNRRLLGAAIRQDINEMQEIADDLDRMFAAAQERADPPGVGRQQQANPPAHAPQAARQDDEAPADQRVPAQSDDEINEDNIRQGPK
jgi:hypothetical protein